MKKKIALVLAFVLVMSVMLSACSSGSEPSSNASDSGSDKTVATTEVKEPSEMKIQYVTKILGNQFYSVVDAGFNAAAKELGVGEYSVTGLANDTELEKQVQLLQDAVSSGADAIVIAPADSTAMVNPIREAHNAGIPIVLVDVMIKSEDFSAAFLTDNVEAGRMCAREMISRLKESGVSEDEEADIALQMSTTGSQTVLDRVQGFNEVWDAEAPELWRVLNDDIKLNEGDISKAMAFTQDFMTTYPNLKGFFAPIGSSAVGFAMALKESGRTDLVLMGFDFAPDIEELIREGKYNIATLVQQPYLMGYQAVEAAIQLAQGKELPQKINPTEVAIVDHDNVEDPDIVKVINPLNK